jgi:hypothetical protein
MNEGKEMGEPKLQTAQDALAENPEQDTINIKYSPGGNNYVEINGEKVECLSRLTVDINAMKLPTVHIDFEPLCVAIETQGTVSFDKTGIPETIARKVYEILKERFEG